MSSTTAVQGGTTPGVRPFGWRDKVGYMFGDFGNDFTFIMASFYLTIFYTKGMGIDPLIVGTMFLVAKLIDAFTDVGMGRLVDRSLGTAAGRFRPWILRGAIPVAVASVGVWIMPIIFNTDSSMTAKIIWMWATYVLWGSITYTMINIPYGAMASVISSEPDDRAQLSVFRSVGATLAALVIVTVTPLFVFQGANILTNSFAWVAVVYAVLAVVCYVMCYSLVRERVKVAPKPKEESMSLGQLFGSMFTNRALLGLVLSAIALLFASLFTGAVGSFLWVEYFRAGEMQSIASFVQFAPALVLALFIVPLGKRFGKKEVGVVGVTICAVITIALYFMNLQSSPWVYVILFAIAGLGLGSFNILIWAFLTDVIDYQDVRSGERSDGTVYAVYSWARKFGQAIASGLGAASLSWIGYNEAQDAVQTPEVINGIWMLNTLVPGVAYAVCAVLLYFVYPLGKKQVEENVAILKARGLDGAVTDA